MQFGMGHFNTNKMNDAVVIEKSPIHGLGVFANRDIKAGEIIAESHVLLLHHNEQMPEAIATLEFPWDDEYYALCISDVGSFFNHSKDATAKVMQQNKEEQTQTFSAVSDIKKGDEVTIFYNDDFEEFIQ
jgi:SET domain-containing protein